MKTGMNPGDKYFHHKGPSSSQDADKHPGGPGRHPMDREHAPRPSPRTVIMDGYDQYQNDQNR